MTRVGTLGALGLVLASATGCKSKGGDGKSASSAGAPAASPAVSIERATGPRCRPLASGKSFTIGEAARKSPVVDAADEDDSSEVGLPFAIEVGKAVATADGFAVGGLKSQAGGTGAFVALVGSKGEGKLVELGRSYGGSDPPRPAARGNRLVVVVPDGSATGSLLRLGLVEDLAHGGRVVWGGEIEQTRDESSAFDVELGPERAVVVWDEVKKSKVPRGIVQSVSFDVTNPSNATRPRTLSPEEADVEAPRLIARPQGFWLTWLARPVKSPGKPERAVSVPKPLSSANPDAAIDESVAGPPLRSVEVVPLDANGSPTAAPRRISSPQSHVTSFDAAPAEGGALLVVWREEPTTPTPDVIHLVRVALEGPLESVVVEDDAEDGTPALLGEQGGTGPNWLVLSSAIEPTRLLALSSRGALLDSLGAEPAIRSADVLSSSHGRLLVARPQGLALALELVECRPGTPSRPDGLDGGRRASGGLADGGP